MQKLTTSNQYWLSNGLAKFDMVKWILCSKLAEPHLDSERFLGRHGFFGISSLDAAYLLLYPRTTCFETLLWSQSYPTYFRLCDNIRGPCFLRTIFSFAWIQIPSMPIDLDKLLFLVKLVTIPSMKEPYKTYLDFQFLTWAISSHTYCTQTCCTSSGTYKWDQLL